MNKNNYVLAMSLLLLVSCGNRRPGMSKEEAAAELKEQAAQEEAVRKERAASVDTFAADYRPPAGIKHQAKILTAGAKTIDVAAALRNVRELKPNELGTPVLYATGVEALAQSSALLHIGDEWVMQAGEGLFLLDKDFRLVKQLFRNDVDIQMGSDGSVSSSFDRTLGVGGFDASLRQFRAPYIDVSNKSYRRGIVNLPWDELRASSQPWTGDDVISFLPSKGAGFNLCVTEGGYMAPEANSSRLYTFGVRGDTLCRFVVNNAPDYVPATMNARTGERNNLYTYEGKSRVRMGYDNAVYELEDASTLKAVWRLDFGGLKRPTRKEVVEGSYDDLRDVWFVEGWLETRRYLFLRLSQGYDCFNTRKADKVKLYTILYNKQTGEGFSLPLAQDEKGLPSYPDLAFEYEGKSFSGFPTGEVDGRLYMLYIGQQLKKLLPDVTSVQALKDKEVVFMMMKNKVK